MEESYTIMICDDNETVQDCLSDYLFNEGLSVLRASDGETALTLFHEHHIDLAVLDIMLPDISGLEVCQKIRKTSNIPIIMLSAKGSVEDRVFGIEMGADDYVTKPYSPWEVTARIKRILQRTHFQSDANVIAFADLTLYPDENKAVVHGEKILLTTKETRVLSCLIVNSNKVCSREQILNVAWGYEYYSEARVVDTLIKRLRKKIMLDQVHFKITAVYGVGYQIEEVL